MDDDELVFGLRCSAIGWRPDFDDPHDHAQWNDEVAKYEQTEGSTYDYVALVRQGRK